MRLSMSKTCVRFSSIKNIMNVNKFVFFIIIVLNISAAGSYPFYKADRKETEPISVPDEVIIKRLGGDTLPASLWPVPHRRLQPILHQPTLHQGSPGAPGYVNRWIPGGTPKFYPHLYATVADGV